MPTQTELGYAPHELCIPEKALPLIEKKKRIKVVYGGRGAWKTFTVVAIAVTMARQGKKILFARKHNSNMSKSLLPAVKQEIKRRKFKGFTELENKIKYRNRTCIEFTGLDKIGDGIKGLAPDIDLLVIDEAGSMPQLAIDYTPSSVRKAGSEIWWLANPESQSSPFSKNFIVPYLKELNANSYYEDDEILVIKTNYYDNPFLPIELEQDRRRDKKIMSSAMYEWKWLGGFNDSVERSIITTDIFNACIDAHKALGWTAKGAKILTFDPSDEGADDKGLTLREGNVVLKVLAKPDGDVKAGCTWATNMARAHNVHHFIYDADGLGAGLAFQVEQELHGTNCAIVQFKGGSTPYNPDTEFKSALLTQDNVGRTVHAKDVKHPVTVREAIKNKRAQGYFSLAERCFNTWNAVVNKVYTDPETMISFNSETIEDIDALRTEVCRIPRKLCDILQIESKEKMKEMGIKSPNMADSVMMSEYIVPRAKQQRTRNKPNISVA